MQRDKESLYYEGVQYQQVALQSPPEEANGSIATTRQNVLADEVEGHVENELSAILNIVEVVFEELHRPSTFIVQGEFTQQCMMLSNKSFAMNSVQLRLQNSLKARELIYKSCKSRRNPEKDDALPRRLCHYDFIVRPTEEHETHRRPS